MGSASLELLPSAETAPLISSPLNIPVEEGAAIPVEEIVRDPEAPTLYAIEPAKSRESNSFDGAKKRVISGQSLKSSLSECEFTKSIP